MKSEEGQSELGEKWTSWEIHTIPVSCPSLNCVYAMDDKFCLPAPQKMILTIDTCIAAVYIFNSIPTDLLLTITRYLTSDQQCCIPISWGDQNLCLEPVLKWLKVQAAWEMSKPCSIQAQCEQNSVHYHDFVKKKNLNLDLDSVQTLLRLGSDF
jgi:hypothetical protein